MSETRVVMADAGELRTKDAVFAVFAKTPSARLLGGFVLLAVMFRTVVGSTPGVADAVALVVTLVGAGTVEWVIHRHLLHAPTDSVRMRVIGTGRGHREHHERPTDVGWILLSRSDVVAFAVGFAPFTAAWAAGAAALFDVSFLQAFASGLVFVALGLAHYEWTHLLVHSGYRPTTRYYAGLARNHRLHHFRNERYWLGVTSNSGDRLLRTLPRKGDVELSATARTLS